MFKIIGFVVLLGFASLAGFVADLVWNDSRIFYLLAGRGALETACRPLTLESLAGRGFSPVDLTFGPHPSISFASGSAGSVKTLAGDITFSDGVDGQRIDGSVVCAVSGHTVKVDVNVDRLPQRAA